MTNRGVTETVVEQAALARRGCRGWAVDTLPPKLNSGELRVGELANSTEATQ